MTKIVNVRSGNHVIYVVTKVFQPEGGRNNTHVCAGARAFARVQDTRRGRNGGSEGDMEEDRNKKRKEGRNMKALYCPIEKYIYICIYIQCNV